jgi:hypothetical protein
MMCRDRKELRPTGIQYPLSVVCVTVVQDTRITTLGSRRVTWSKFPTRDPQFLEWLTNLTCYLEPYARYVWTYMFVCTKKHGVDYAENISRHRTKFSRPGNQAPGFVHPWCSLWMNIVSVALIFNPCITDWVQYVPRLGIFFNRSRWYRVTDLPVRFFVLWSPLDTKLLRSEYIVF